MIKIFDKDGYKNRGRLLGFGSGADADWRVIFSLFLILMVLSAIYCGAFFLKVMGGGFGSESKDEGESPIDKNLLHKVAEFYKDKKATIESLKTTKDTAPDPSL